jgi:hypothetical protein
MTPLADSVSDPLVILTVEQSRFGLSIPRAYSGGNAQSAFRIHPNESSW